MHGVVHFSTDAKQIFSFSILKQYVVFGDTFLFLDLSTEHFSKQKLQKGIICYV